MQLEDPISYVEGCRMIIFARRTNAPEPEVIHVAGGYWFALAVSDRYIAVRRTLRSLLFRAVG